MDKVRYEVFNSDGVFVHEFINFEKARREAIHFAGNIVTTLDGRSVATDSLAELTNPYCPYCDKIECGCDKDGNLRRIEE